uniref:Glutathione peroxidase n=1 Tax=Grammatophora oceanica TaxID=210454 RepID=A0A7S1VSR4_9STRA|mmetsp:Transcript_53616/g.80017  ORF Transcript_53616/g.80017 Transcript_53616/m.80017 type:complete len:133 (+) Transcript_53616:401-799(+)|eukprot:CAMPEP_0194046048 /NCGR_PEP_ID=MMETSP0009_2-20130614/19153_1 /TAXON_ID=210454 /ORGANISM="Grammatophora oceanica, Strain CCMP 410" /LENGTH=132 /DNA_ID=CAMNT_0038691169 /DNA_START=401 /DNA_END=799 /DNA_ORIENTATION=+
MADANYRQLVKLHNEYHTRGFKVCAFPCNQFGGQEPGSAEEILEFASKYDDADKKFVFFEKAYVNGEDTREVYSFLKSKLPSKDETTDIRWSYTVFLVDHKGTPIKRLFPSKTPYDKVKPVVEKLLDEKDGK